jgi:hypothetical protein
LKNGGWEKGKVKHIIHDDQDDFHSKPKKGRRMALHFKSDQKQILTAKLTLSRGFVFIQIAFLVIVPTMPFNTRFYK